MSDEIDLPDGWYILPPEEGKSGRRIEHGPATNSVYVKVGAGKILGAAYLMIEGFTEEEFRKTYGGVPPNSGFLKACEKVWGTSAANILQHRISVEANRGKTIDLPDGWHPLEGDGLDPSRPYMREYNLPSFKGGRAQVFAKVSGGHIVGLCQTSSGHTPVKDHLDFKKRFPTYSPDDDGRRQALFEFEHRYGSVYDLLLINLACQKKADSASESGLGGLAAILLGGLFVGSAAKHMLKKRVEQKKVIEVPHEQK